MYKHAIDIWFRFYRDKTGQEYVMDGMQGRHMKQLLKKIEAKVKQKGIDVTNENVINSLSGFLHHINDNWILEHLEISIINSKFNILYAKAVKSSPFTSQSRIDDLIERRFGDGGIPGQGSGN